jgi:hypothetical protein
MMHLVESLISTRMVQEPMHVEEPNFFAHHAECPGPKSAPEARKVLAQGAHAAHRDNKGRHDHTRGKGDKELIAKNDEADVAVFGWGDRFEWLNLVLLEVAYYRMGGGLWGEIEEKECEAKGPIQGACPRRESVNWCGMRELKVNIHYQRAVCVDLERRVTFVKPSIEAGSEILVEEVSDADEECIRC